jgi:hypothetical protein
MSERDKWKFRRDKQDVLAGARQQLEHHEHRLQYWRQKQEETMSKIKADGLEIDESLGYGSNTSHGRGPQVLVRQDYQTDLNETHQKIKEHEYAVQEYAGWVQFLEKPGPAEVELDISDHLFFFKRTAVQVPV